MIEESFVSFKTAKMLKEKGFEQNTDYATSWYANQYYKNSCQGEWFEGEHQIIKDIDDKCNISYLSERGIFIPAPTLQMAMKWLRDIYGWFIHIDVIREASCWLADIQDIKNDVAIYAVEDEFSTYEEACEAAVLYCLENLI